MQAAAGRHACPCRRAGAPGGGAAGGGVRFRSHAGQRGSELRTSHVARPSGRQQHAGRGGCLPAANRGCAQVCRASCRSLFAAHPPRPPPSGLFWWYCRRASRWAALWAAWWWRPSSCTAPGRWAGWQRRRPGMASLLPPLPPCAPQPLPPRPTAQGGAADVVPRAIAGVFRTVMTTTAMSGERAPGTAAAREFGSLVQCRAVLAPAALPAPLPCHPTPPPPAHAAALGVVRLASIEDLKASPSWGCIEWHAALEGLHNVGCLPGRHPMVKAAGALGGCHCHKAPRSQAVATAVCAPCRSTRSHPSLDCLPVLPTYLTAHRAGWRTGRTACTTTEASAAPTALRR